MSRRQAAGGVLLENAIRGGIVAFLVDRGAGDFSEIAKALEVRNNVLSGHLERLETGGHVTLERGFLGRRPRTRVRLTTAGRAAWRAYLESMEE